MENGWNGGDKGGHNPETKVGGGGGDIADGSRLGIGPTGVGWGLGRRESVGDWADGSRLDIVKCTLIGPPGGSIPAAHLRAKLWTAG